jgi:nitroreductase
MKDIINQLIRERHSVYPVNFDPSRKIASSLINELLENAVWAPSHGLTQPWSFRIFHGDGVRTFFAAQKEVYLAITPSEQVKKVKLDNYNEKASQVSHVIAVCMIRDKNRRFPEIEEIVATACVIQNIYLCLGPYGIAGYLSTGAVCYAPQMKAFLKLGENDHCLGFFQLGYARPQYHRPVRNRIPAAEKTLWVDE